MFVQSLLYKKIPEMKFQGLYPYVKLQTLV